MKLHPVSLLLPLLAGCASTGGPSRTGGPPPRGTEPMTNEDILVVYSRGADGMLSDPRDAGLRDALELVDERVIEVAEMAGKDLPIPMLQLARDLLLSPLSFRADFSFGGGMTNTPFKAQLTVEGTPEEVRSIADRVAPLLGTIPIPAEPVEGKEGLSTLKTPVGPAYVGRNGDTFV
ncbi:MAG TPA: hypothetical protein ENJ09_15575, partial [Planctomycetes bacterium]|nr:hypothetical protein [Planctomycetota bacterium]